MGMKVRRGLGMLVVALLAFILGAVVMQASDPISPSVVTEVLVLSFGGITVVSAVVGLVLIAWGLLGD